ncbi:hypothetical protein MMC32_008265 [Xylographa parallela]|nr:hypothetical protein [Xylographa parallela]
MTAIHDDNNIIYGERLLPQVLDQYARTDPQRVYGSYAISSDLTRGFRDVTMNEMANAVDFFAWWIKDTVGESDHFEAMAYTLLLGPRNAAIQNQNLLERTQCTKLLYSSEMTRVVEPLQGICPQLTVIEVQTLDELLSKCSRRFIFNKTFADAQKDPILVIHSSGSTGNPKLITMTHGTLSATDNDRYMPTPRGRLPQNGAQFNFKGGGRFFSCFPPYHLAGIQAILILPLFSTSATIVLGPSTVPPSGHIMHEAIRHQKQTIKAFYVPPSVLEQWAQEGEALEQAKQLDFVLYGGGPLSPVIGDLLSQVTDVCQMYGSAETGQIQLLVPQRGEWPYMEWNPFEEVDMQFSVEGAFEMVLHQHPKFYKRRSLCHNFPDVKEWRTGDLFIPHPTKTGLWRFHARVDDLILLSNGHKINPVAMESALSAHPLLSGSIVIGTGRAQPALLIELKSDIQRSERHNAIESIWPTIQHANAAGPTYGQITRSKILLSNISKPFVRAAKGNIVRRSTTEAYTAEIDSLFADALVYDENPILVDTSINEIACFLRETIEVLLPDAKVDNDVDFFASGLDSLKLIELVSGIRRSLRNQDMAKQFKVSNEDVYNYPTILQLAKFLYASLSPSHVTELEADDRVHMDDLTLRYTHSWPSIACNSNIELNENLCVILTGSTGSLGSKILEILSRTPRVSKIYCLNRSQNVIRNEGEQSIHKGNPQDSPHNKIENIQVDFTKTRLGLSETIYAMLLANVDNILHVAWTVNFNLTLQSYEAHHIRGLRSLIDFSITSKRHPRIIFASSTAYAIDWADAHARDSVPETVLVSSHDVSSTGYGQSKQVAERILTTASDICNIPVTILRIGQIAGSTFTRSKGNWPKNEWISSLIKTSEFLNLIPSANLSIDWIPREELAQVILEIMLCSFTDNVRLQVYNLVNPRRTSWTTLTDVLTRQLSTAKVVSLQEWVDILATYDADDVGTLQNVPAMKIILFFQSLAERTKQETRNVYFVTDNAVRVSQTMAVMPSIGAAWLRSWINI